ncbi:hypothetical protein GCM10010420_10370 [Streptomyces glaucosporus]|uniref:AB hydrolase-1 domain-containing protein n=1 Tax=Streptomyces glaucosporus TaxID=284044 RepID=A0ABN3HVJ5_9ACTN
MDVGVTDPERTGEERLPGGRLLGWAEWGPEDGVPVLFSPGAGTSRHLGFGSGAVTALGVRLIALDRPGLGASTPSPGRTFAGFAEDVRVFAAARGLGRPAMVGNSQGAPFALACAARGVVGALAVVSGADEIADPRFADALPDGLRRLVGTAVADPAAAERILAGFTPRAMADMVLAGSPECDLAVYRHPAFAAAWRRALEEGFAQGPEGYARDTALVMGRWKRWGWTCRRSPCRWTCGTARRTPPTPPTGAPRWRHASPEPSAVSSPESGARCCGRTPRRSWARC